MSSFLDQDQRQTLPQASLGISARARAAFPHKDQYSKKGKLPIMLNAAADIISLDRMGFLSYRKFRPSHLPSSSLVLRKDLQTGQHLVAAAHVNRQFHNAAGWRQVCDLQSPRVTVAQEDIGNATRHRPEPNPGVNTSIPGPWRRIVTIADLLLQYVLHALFRLQVPLVFTADWVANPRSAPFTLRAGVSHLSTDTRNDSAWTFPTLSHHLCLHSAAVLTASFSSRAPRGSALAEDEAPRKGDQFDLDQLRAAETPSDLVSVRVKLPDGTIEVCCVELLRCLPL